MPGALKPLGAGFLPADFGGRARSRSRRSTRTHAGAASGWFDLIATWNAKVDLTAARTSG